MNGDAIYGTTACEKRPQVMKKEGINYTAKGNDLYVICTKWPENPFTVKNIGKAGKVSMLGTNAKVKPSVKKGKLTMLTLPALNPGNAPSQYAWVFKVENVK